MCKKRKATFESAIGTILGVEGEDLSRAVRKHKESQRQQKHLEREFDASDDQEVRAKYQQLLDKERKFLTDLVWGETLDKCHPELDRKFEELMRERMAELDHRQLRRWAREHVQLERDRLASLVSGLKGLPPAQREQVLQQFGSVPHEKG